MNTQKTAFIKLFSKDKKIELSTISDLSKTIDNLKAQESKYAKNVGQIESKLKDVTALVAKLEPLKEKAKKTSKDLQEEFEYLKEDVETQFDLNIGLIEEKLTELIKKGKDLGIDVKNLQEFKQAKAAIKKGDLAISHSKKLANRVADIRDYLNSNFF